MAEEPRPAVTEEVRPGVGGPTHGGWYCVMTRLGPGDPGGAPEPNVSMEQLDQSTYRSLSRRFGWSLSEDWPAMIRVASSLTSGCTAWSTASRAISTAPSRCGTAKLLTLFRPATGEVRATGVRQATSAVLHPWLQEELTAVVAALPEALLPGAERPKAARWATWLGHPPREPLPPLRLILIWDNLAGHLSWSIVHWLFQHGVMPLYTPLGGSWLNMAKSLQRIPVGRALAGAHPQSPQEIIQWREETVAGWDAAPTPCVWDGTRRERRQRARQRRLGGSGATLPELLSIAV